MKTITSAALAIALLGAAVEPAAAQDRVHQQMAAELRMLQQQQAELALAFAQLAESLTRTLQGIDTRIESTNERLTKGFADQALSLRNLEQEAGRIRAATQENSTRLGELREEIAALRRSLTEMVNRLTYVPPPAADPLDAGAPPAPGVAPGDPGAQVQAPPPVPLPLPSTLGLSPDQVFETARADYAAGQWDLAIAGFEDFIRTFSNSNRADDAQQYIGDAEYFRNRFPEAIAAYNRVIQNYPQEDQVPWAYYKRGLAQERLGQREQALQSLELAIKAAGRPDHDVTGLAQQNLDRLTRNAAQRP